MLESHYDSATLTAGGEDTKMTFSDTFRHSVKDRTWGYLSLTKRKCALVSSPPIPPPPPTPSLWRSQQSPPFGNTAPDS
ncbi:hypothetical protein ILYODFUR_007344 [Ilyodon furcidens]|uniref:Uncharacterized protein n=1 Tax=Ilyodon furcidens TaxID=33524 RepID=A0ABV0SUY6_9TELE